MCQPSCLRVSSVSFAAVVAVAVVAGACSTPPRMGQPPPPDGGADLAALADLASPAADSISPPVPDLGSGGGSDGAADGAIPDAAAAGAEAGPSANDTTSCATCDPVVNAIDLDVADMVFDPQRRRLYATIRGAAGPGAEGLAFIDPSMHRVVGTMTVGPGAGALALSEDRSTLWISVEREYAIRRLDLTTTPPTLGPLMPVPGDGRGPEKTIAAAMVVLPGTSRSLVVSLIYPRLSYAFASIVVMDDGVPRPGRPERTGDPINLTGGPPGHAFGYNTHSTGFELCALTITPTGLTQTCHRDLIGDKFGDDITYADGRIYAHGGAVIDVTTPDAPRRAGRFAFRGAVIPQRGRRILMLSAGFDLESSGTAQLRVLEADNFTQVTSASLFTIGNGELRDGQQIADDEVAAIARGSGRSRIIFVRSPLVKAGG